MFNIHTLFATLLAVLTSVGFMSSAEAGSCPGIAIPAYFYPGTTWTTATNSAPRVEVMIMNPNSGVGTVQDPQYLKTVKTAQTAGIKVLGYVASGYGNQTTRPLAKVLGEIDTYKSWYGVDGIFVDEVASSVGLAPYYQQIVDRIHLGKGGFVMLNPGIVPAASYINMADSTIVFEGSYATYLKWTMPSWLFNYPSSKLTHLVYATSSAQMPNAVKLGIARNAGKLYITDDVLNNPWDTLPTYWTTLLSNILAGCNK